MKLHHTCPQCFQEALKYAMIDLDGTNLEEGYSCADCGAEFIGIDNERVVEINEDINKNTSSIGVIIGRYINGISLNELEYVLESEDGDYKHFDSIESAKQFLREAGVDDEDELDDYFVYKYHTFCLNCGKEHILDTIEVFEDNLGVGHLCTECDSSFDVV